jgi:hypothetical protein
MQQSRLVPDTIAFLGSPRIIQGDSGTHLGDDVVLVVVASWLSFRAEATSTFSSARDVCTADNSDVSCTRVRPQVCMTHTRNLKGLQLNSLRALLFIFSQSAPVPPWLAPLTLTIIVIHQRAKTKEPHTRFVYTGRLSMFHVEGSSEEGLRTALNTDAV